MPDKIIRITTSKIIFISLVFLIFLSLFSFSSIFQPTSPSNTITEIRGKSDLESKFNVLSNARTNSCSGSDFIQFKSEEERLQGSCCSPMDFHRYSEQVEGLKNYSAYDIIPSDPYDIPVSLAKKLLDYKKTIELSADEQAVYDEAMKLSHEGGPCCCKCWRWYAFEGQAKYLIKEYNFNAQQIAEVWDLEDGCGGSGHSGHGFEIHERVVFDPQN